MNLKSKINLGCGLIKPAEYTNIDKLHTTNPDILLDLEQYPWPLPDNQFEEVLISHLVEHTGRMGDEKSWFRFWEEVWRISKPGSMIYCIAPYYLDHNSVGDPGHRRLISESSFYFLSKEVYKSNAERKTAMTQYKIGFDFEVKAQKVFKGELKVWMKAIK